MYEGDWSQFYSSQSEADMAFANDLAFWTARDPVKMDEIFGSQTFIEINGTNNEVMTHTVISQLIMQLKVVRMNLCLKQQIQIFNYLSWTKL